MLTYDEYCDMMQRRSYFKIDIVFHNARDGMKNKLHNYSGDRTHSIHAIMDPKGWICPSEIPLSHWFQLQ